MLKRKRKNLEGIYLKCGLVVAFPDVFTTIDDMKMRHIDTIAKANYPITSTLKNDMNFNFDLRQMNNYGWRKSNGSFDGMVGYLQRNELDFCVNALFMRLDRIKIIQFVGETYHMRACTMFRQPPLSAVTNIFALPFSKEVWYTIFMILIIITLIMTMQIYNPFNTIRNVSFSDCFLFSWGALCQQDSSLSLIAISARIKMFTAFVTTLFLYIFFSANIVALLQSPSEAIHSLEDLTNSPLDVGVQDTVYNKVYFKESVTPIVKNFYEKKIQPKGEKVYMRPHIGMEMVRKKLFAYQVEAQTGYQIISDTFDEHEKCGLKELEPFTIPMTAIPTRNNFPYGEIFRQRLRWQREVGLIKREELRWFPQKPTCGNKVAGFVSVSLTECRYALKMFAFGIGISFFILLCEIFYIKFKTSKYKYTK